MDKLEACKQTREIAADSLYKTLRKVLNSNKKVSELTFRDLWLKELRKSKKIFPEGWYNPPPFGMGVLFATDENPGRVNIKSLRVKNLWPNNKVFLNKKNGICFFYFSPVDRASGMIGDFQITLYFGKTEAVKDLFRLCLSIDKQIFDHIKLRMSFSEITAFANNIIKENGLKNVVESISDKSVVNIGHTFPFSYENMKNHEIKILDNAESKWTDFIDLISKKRVYVNYEEKFKVKRNLIFTIEPRLKLSSKLPTISFHCVVGVDAKGKKNLITNFDKIFQLAGMSYMKI